MGYLLGVLISPTTETNKPIDCMIGCVGLTNFDFYCGVSGWVIIWGISDINI